VGCQKAQCGGTVSELDATAAPEGTNTPYSGDRGGSNANVSGIYVLHAISLRNIRTLAAYANDDIGVKSIKQEEYVHVRVSHSGPLASSDSLKESF